MDYNLHIGLDVENDLREARAFGRWLQRARWRAKRNLMRAIVCESTAIANQAKRRRGTRRQQGSTPDAITDVREQIVPRIRELWRAADGQMSDVPEEPRPKRRRSRSSEA